MSGAGGFRAAIEEQKRVARERDEERKRSVSQHSSMPVSPTTGPYDAPTTSSTLDTLGFGFDWGREPDVLESTSNVPVKNEDDASRKVLTTSDAVRNPPVGNNFAGLTSARKRSRVGKDLEENMKPAPALKSPMEETEEDEEDDDEKPAGKRPFAPAKKISNRATRQAPEEIQRVNARTTPKPGDWYQNVNMRAKYARSDLVALQNIIDLIKDCQKTVANSVQRGLLFTKIRQRLHQMEFYAFLTPVLVKKSKVLEENAGLPQIFYDAMGVEYPWDIKDDALLLYQKWMCGIFDPYLLRGITSDRKKHAGGKKSMSHRLDKTYTGRVSCNVVGENGLRNGQWWPMQICAMRDGAHGEIEGGIHGQPEKGAFSIILSGGGYEDRDEGERILYCGTSGTEGKPTAGTNHLKLTHRLGNPLRVLRSASLPSSNPWCPEMGIRYDGLYNVIGFEILDEATAMHRFVLQRRTDQYPIRFQGEEARPTDEEKSQYSNIRELLGVKA